MRFIRSKKTSLNKEKQTPKESDTQFHQRADYWKPQNFKFTSFRSAMTFRNHTAKRRSSAFFFFFPPFLFFFILQEERETYEKGGKLTNFAIMSTDGSLETTGNKIK